MLNNLEIEPFASDLWDLFGSEDNFAKALVGKWDPVKGDFKSITWDWSVSNLKHIINILYFLDALRKGRSYSQENFDEFYDTQIKSSENVVQALSEMRGRKPLQVLYVMKYKKQFPALQLELEKISWRRGKKRQLLITFKPTHYFLVDPISWLRIKEKAKNVEEWIKIYGLSSRSVFNDIFEKYINMKQSIYGLVPKSILYEEMRRSRVLFIKPVEQASQARVISDNIIFWELFYHFIGKLRVRYTVSISIDGLSYSVTRIPIDALNENSYSYKHEAGAANTLSHALVDLFGKKYLDYEFKDKEQITYKEASVFRREYRIEQIRGEESNKFANSDYDFALCLQPLGLNKVILVELTTALWKKGLYDYRALTEKWRETYFNIPTRHKEIILIWYILIPETEERFFQSSPSGAHKNFDEMLNDLSLNADRGEIKVISDEDDLVTYNGERIILLKIFKKSPTAKTAIREIENLLHDYKKTLFYQMVTKVIKSLKA